MLLICCGMPRSGSTLQFNISWKTATSGGLGKRVEWRSSSDWENADVELARMEAATDLHVIKMHFPPDSVKKLAEAGGSVRFVYVHRDLFDVVYSMRTKFNFSLAHAINRVSQALDAERWLLARPTDQVLIQDYALLLNNLPEAVRQVATFEGAQLDDSQLAAISEELSITSAYEKSRQKAPRFEHIRRKINRVIGRKITFANDELMLHPNHVSEHRGQIGVGLKKLSEAEVATIRSAFGDRIAGTFNVR